MDRRISTIFIILISIILIICIASVFLEDGKDILEEQDIYIYEESSTVEENETKNNDLFGEYYEKAEKILNQMTLDEKVGQMFLVRYGNYDVIQEIKNEAPGGYILFAVDFKDKSKEQIIEELNSCQENSKIKLFLGVDEEGGKVVRVSKYKEFRDTPFLSIQELDRIGGLNEVLKDSKEKSVLLKSLGLNMNLAPVVDIPKDVSSFIYSRSMGKSAEETAIYTKSIIEVMNEENMISVLKHFPGYGDNVDTHTGIAVDSRNFETFEEEDFLPFISGIEAKSPMIMINHNIIECMNSVVPASLSKEVVSVLRENLKFTGLIITDDINMGALQKYVENNNAATQAILAGNDIVITSDFKNHKAEVLNAVKDGIISENLINEAVRKILACKLCYKIT